MLADLRVALIGSRLQQAPEALCKQWLLTDFIQCVQPRFALQARDILSIMHDQEHSSGQLRTIGQGAADGS